MNKILFKKFYDDLFFDLKKTFLKNSELFFSKEKNYLLLNESFMVEKKILNSILQITKKEKKGIDVTFLLKKKHFFNININLQKGVFVPQPDTELLVEKILSKKEQFKKGLEIGVGTGAISLSILKNSSIKMTGLDISPKAINLTKNNLKLNNLKMNLQLIDYFKFNSKVKYDFIVCNPPYISKEDLKVSDWVKKNQPSKAIYSKNDGMFFIKNLIKRFEKNLTKNGILYFEFGLNQEKKLIPLLLAYKYNLYKDLNNKYRVIEIFSKTHYEFYK